MPCLADAAKDLLAAGGGPTGPALRAHRGLAVLLAGLRWYKLLGLLFS